MKDYAELNDNQLVALWRENDGGAVKELSLRYSKVSKAIASKFSFSPEEIADLSQEGMIGFLSAVYTYSENGKASFLTYAYGCIRNSIISVVRKSTSQKRVPEKLITSLQLLPNEAAVTETPEEILIRERSIKHITSLIEELLTENEKKVLKLYLSGMSYNEIGEETSLSPKAVDSTLQRGRKKLRERLNSYK